jgi:hypothetical protein
VGCLGLETLHLCILGAYLLVQDLHPSLEQIHIPLQITYHCGLPMQLFFEVFNDLQQLL